MYGYLVYFKEGMLDIVYFLNDFFIFQEPQASIAVFKGLLRKIKAW